MKSYLKYIPSTIAGVDQVPKHWKVYRLKSLAQIIPSNVDKKTKEGEQEVYLCNYLDVYNNDFITENDDFMKASASETQIEKLLLQESDVIATKDSEDPYDIGIPTLVKTSFDDVVCGYHLTLIRSKKSLLDGNWLYWYLRSNHTAQYFAKIARGITRYALGTDAFKNIPISLPPIQEQESIANFLDEKVNLINETINDKERLLNLYEEEKKAIIKHAVTKGIDPNVILKDSGIAWLGKIPKHWKLAKISRSFNIIGSGATPKSGLKKYHFEGTHNWLLTGNLNDGIITETPRKITSKALEDYSALKKYPKGSIVIAMYGATIGKLGILDVETTTNQACCVMHGSSVFDTQYAFYHLLSIRNEIINLSVGGGQPNISQEIIKSIKLVCPSIVEQKEIVSYINDELQVIENKKNDIKKETKLLKEFKESLIFEAVTGKIDVAKFSLN
ncbi:unnamed protein product [Ectocarpus sp. 12 AP-2014]